MADCMNEVRQVLDAEGLALHLPVDEHNSVHNICSEDAPMQTSPLSDVEFADGGTIMIIMPAEGLYDAMCRALVLVSDVFASRGHLLNIGPAKTAALMCLRGKVAKIAKRDIWHSHGGMLGGNSALLGHVTAPVVRNYVHLGSVIDATGAMMSEIRYRASSTTDTLRVLRTKVFGPSDMSDSTRMMFADSLVMSGRLYNAGAWSDLTLGENKHADGEVMKVYRAAARVRFDEADSCVSNQEVLAQLQRPPPAILRRAARLRLLGSLLHTGPKIVFALLRAEWEGASVGANRSRTWLGMILRDCDWLRKSAAACVTLAPAAEDFGPWELLIRKGQPAWKRIIGLALKATAQAHLRSTAAAASERDFFSIVSAAGVPPRVYTDINGLLVDPPAPPSAPTSVDVQCPWCDVKFRKGNAFRAHVARAHRQQASLAKAWASPNGQCNACLATYHNRQHLVDHLATDSPRCLFVLMSEPVGPVGTGFVGLG